LYYARLLMLPQLFAVAGIIREKLAEEGLAPAAKPRLKDLCLEQRLALINGVRSYRPTSPLTEDDYFLDERRWVRFLYEQDLVRPRWM